jgi:hypothetical protein
MHVCITVTSYMRRSSNHRLFTTISLSMQEDAVTNRICIALWGSRASTLLDGTCNAFFALAGQILHLILYSDGVTPGSTLAADNQRKASVFYFSFLEFSWRLQCEEVWIPIAVARTCSHISCLATADHSLAVLTADLSPGSVVQTLKS